MRKIDVPLTFAIISVVAIVLAALLAPAIWPESYYHAQHGPHQEAYNWIRDCLSSAAFWTAIFTGLLTWSTIGLWKQTRRLAEGAEVQANDIRAQLKVVQDDFVSTHRPWIGFVARIGANGIKFDRHGMHIHMLFECTNTGTTPGIGVSVNADAFVWSPLLPEISRLEYACKRHGISAITPSKEITGTTIFPGRQWQFERTYLIAQRELDAINTTPKTLIVAVAGCIDYAFAFGPLESHQSRFILYIGKPSVPFPKRVERIVTSDGDIVPKDLRIIRSDKLEAFKVT